MNSIRAFCCALLNVRLGVIASLVALALVLMSSSIAFAEQKETAKPQTRVEPPKSAFSVLNIFDGQLPSVPAPKGEVVLVTDPVIAVAETSATISSEQSSSVASSVASAEAVSSKEVLQASSSKAGGPEFVSSDPKSHIVPPHQDPRVRINPEAPGPFKAMAAAFQDGDMETAKAYADQYVRYQIKLMFEVREMTKLIGEALVRQDLVEEDDMVGVDQYIDITFARARTETQSAVRPTHKHAMERVKSDPEHKVEIYYFFSLNCSWCREMSPDIERLWRVTKGDKKVKFVAAVIGNHSPEWIESYRSYTGLTAPIMNGTEAAKALRIGVVPAVVMVSPTQQISYLKTGQQPFDRLYEFLRTVQGLPAKMTPEIERLLKTPIGNEEKQKGTKPIPLLPAAPPKVTSGPVLTPVSDGVKAPAKKDSVDRF